jgi:membrane protein YdbS with pleckstrin-like domain
MTKTRQKYPINKKKIIKKVIISSLAFLFLFSCVGIFGIILAVSDNSNVGIFMVIGSILAFAAVVVLSYLYHTWHFATYFYEILPEYVMIRKGPIMPNEITILYQKIQDVYVDQDLFDRMMGLYDVHIATATFSSGNLAHIDGLLKEDAGKLRDELLGIFKSKISK